MQNYFCEVESIQGKIMRSNVRGKTQVTAKLGYDLKLSQKEEYGITYMLEAFKVDRSIHVLLLHRSKKSLKDRYTKTKKKPENEEATFLRVLNSKRGATYMYVIVHRRGLCLFLFHNTH